MNDKQQLAAMGEHLAEQQQPLCMAKRIEELEAQVRALTLPEGWKLVPVEPTLGMSLAGAVAQAEKLKRYALGGSLPPIDHGMPDAYSAMLAAAPQPEAK